MINTAINVLRNDSSTESNPLTLTPFVNDAGEIWLKSEGNGCGDDVMLSDIEGESDEAIRETWSSIDLDALRKAADEIEEAGDEDSADWIRDWAERCERATKTIFEVLLVPNGSMSRLIRNKSADSGCTTWWTCDSLEEAVEKMRALATENFCREEGPWDSVWAENMDFDAVNDDEERRRANADAIAQKALDEYVASCIDAMQIEWHNDLSFVKVVRCTENGEIIEVL